MTHLEKRWFSTIAWNGILTLNIQTIQELKIVMEDKSLSKIFGKISQEEIGKFLQKNISVSEVKLSNIKKVAFLITVYCN